MGKIDRVVKIVSLVRDENQVMAENRAGCLALSPDERVEEMRRRSRRLISLNPRNPPCARIERHILRIVHDAV